MASAGATRDSVWWMRVLGPIGALIMAAGFVIGLLGALDAEASSSWDYCGEIAPCHCPAGERMTTWPGDDPVCFTAAPANAQMLANLGSATAAIGSLLLLSSVLLRLRRAGKAWLVIRSALIGFASLSLGLLAALLASGPACLDCPSSPSDPALVAAAIATGAAAIFALGAATVPVAFRIATRPAT